MESEIAMDEREVKRIVFPRLNVSLDELGRR
jgi:hypothetical protein